MTLSADDSRLEFDPWHPGLESQVPREMRHLSTMFRADNVFTSLTKADELHDLTGLPSTDIVAFRPERLALHEILVRVTADLSVPDGERIEDLGINFREITRTILARYVEPRMRTIRSTYAEVRHALSGLIDGELASLFSEPLDTSPRATNGLTLGLFARFRRKPVSVAQKSGLEAEMRLIESWQAKAQGGSDELEQCAYRALARLASALHVRHGRLWGSRELIAALATDLACNGLASTRIGGEVESCVAEAVLSEGFLRLPRQDEPVVMNTKGASASGKSTLRPLQKALAGEIGVRWREFALISPDIWRKQLLDYASLGAAYKYGAALTGDELAIIDHKLDRYMARKAERGQMSHLLIDRFRFDSFAPDSEEAGSNLLTRFGHIVYLFFMITPPELLVERAWKRGLDVGRYKAVDDTLAHGVEAYEGMPEIFFTWIERPDKRVHFEFLDNAVPMGERPRTVAFGRNDVLNVLDIKCLLDIQRYRRVDINATMPAELYRDPALLAASCNTAFLKACVQRFSEVRFAEQNSGRVYLRMSSGKPAWTDRSALDRVLADPDMQAGIDAIAPGLRNACIAEGETPQYLADCLGVERIQTLGQWGAGTLEING